jgi:hypothetical protein
MNNLSYSSSTHTTNPSSQLYLWILSRLDTNKLVQRSIIAQRTPIRVKMVLTEYNFDDTLPCGMPIRIAMKKYNGTEIASSIVTDVFCYIRRKPTVDGVYQVVLMWN